jgi:hypothetical protein
MFAALSSTRRHAAAARAACETSVLELWKFEHELVDNHQLLSISKSTLPNSMQLEELRRVVGAVERVASDAMNLDHILGTLQISGACLLAC